MTAPNRRMLWLLARAQRRVASATDVSFADLDPDLSGDTAVVIGMGNVALDVARMLAKHPEGK